MLPWLILTGRLIGWRRKIWNWILIEIVRSKFGRDFETETWSGFWNQTLIKIGLRSLEFLMYDLINRSYFDETFGLLCLVKELEDSIYFLLSVKERSNIKEPGLTSMQKVRFSPSLIYCIDSCSEIEFWEVQFGACCFISSVRSSNSHPDLLVITSTTTTTTPLFQIHTGPQHWTFTFWATTAI